VHCDGEISRLRKRDGESSLNAVRALVVTNMYPTADVPNAGPFIAAQVESLRSAGVDVEVLHLERTQGRNVYRGLGKNVKALVSELEPDLIHVMYGGVMADAVTRALPARPVLVSFCGTDLLAGRGNGVVERIALRYGALASRRAARRAAGIIVKSRNLFEALPGEVDRGRVWIVPNGVDVSRFRPLDRAECQRQLGWHRDHRHVLFPAPPSRPEKRYALAEATIELANTLEPRVELHALEGVPHDDVPIWINAANAVVLTSAHEGSPNAVKEALACNVPVVSVDVGDVRERIEGVEGCFIAAPNPADLADKLGRALERGEPIAGREHVAALSLEHVAAKVHRIYASLANDAVPTTRGGG
jgi:glycosyltransferase involved in cell wall biosynthesis